ncbi:MAG: hypothetical protein HYT21_02790 [Candidatus Nealsonbacteria bacterium]|nr:hypothetical protein [Candidatus Nealsonbacteria bacterium]
MTDNELIHNLKCLKEIKPRKDWVVLTKSRILAQEQTREAEEMASVFSVFRYKLAFAPILSVVLVIGLFGFAQGTMPGDFFFSIKKATETVQVGFSSEMEKPKVQLQLANKRLAELSQIAESNQVGKLEPAIKEFQASLVQATQNLNDMDANVTSSDAIVLRELVEETLKLAENKERVERVLGAEVGDTQDLKNALSVLEKQTAGYLIEDLSSRTLTEEKQELLKQAMQDYDAGLYQEALYKLWQAHNNQ